MYVHTFLGLFQLDAVSHMATGKCWLCVTVTTFALFSGVNFWRQPSILGTRSSRELAAKRPDIKKEEREVDLHYKQAMEAGRRADWVKVTAAAANIISEFLLPLEAMATPRLRHTG